MASPEKANFLKELKQRYGQPVKLPGSQSLYDLPSNNVRIYIRYSAVHETERTFFGLREQDLKQLDGRNSFLCLLWPGQGAPTIVPYHDYDEIIRSSRLASDGQYKVQIYLRDGGHELFIPSQGRFNIEAYQSWDTLDTAMLASKNDPPPDLNHSQVQSLLGAIGHAKGFDIWIPMADRGHIDKSFAKSIKLRNELPKGMDTIRQIIQEVDVIWIERGSSNFGAFYEVEHTTSIYSGLLRFNDIHLAFPQQTPSFGIVAKERRKARFIKQLLRPTFMTSGLSERCSFLDYSDVYGWYKRLM